MISQSGICRNTSGKRCLSLIRTTKSLMLNSTRTSGFRFDRAKTESCEDYPEQQTRPNKWHSGGHQLSIHWIGLPLQVFRGTAGQRVKRCSRLGSSHRILLTNHYFESRKRVRVEIVALLDIARDQCALMSGFELPARNLASAANSRFPPSLPKS